MKYVVLDFGNVIAGPTTGKWFLTPKFYKEINIEEIDMDLVHLNMAEASPYLSDKMITLDDEIKSMKKYYKTLLKGTGFEDKADIIAEDFVYCDDKYTLFSTVKNELDILSKNHKLVLLTDNWPCGERVLKDFGLYDYFEKVYISSVYQEVKKDGKFFDIMMEDLNIKENEAYFVDDNLEILDVASSKGLKCFLMDRQSITKNAKYPVINNLYDLINKIKVHF